MEQPIDASKHPCAQHPQVYTRRASGGRWLEGYTCNHFDSDGKCPNAGNFIVIMVNMPIADMYK